MGSYSAPSQIWPIVKEIVDNTFVDDQVVIASTRCINFMGAIEHSALFDGILLWQAQQLDDSWDDVLTYDISDDVNQGLYPTDVQNAAQPVGYKYPYYIRLIVDTAPTLGVATCRLTTMPGPANPLF